MQFLQVLLNIIIFLLCLSVVVCIHEAGHLIAAKSFRVYCFEYSIGFGPKLFHKKFRHKRKNPVYDADKEIHGVNTDVMVQPRPIDSTGFDDERTKLLRDLSTQDQKEKETKKEDPNYEYGETYFSIRALPLGGYVSMAGEDSTENEDGVVVPKERTLPGINHAKQIVIMLAGIFMNFILAFVLFFCDFAFCNQKRSLLDTNAVTVSEKINGELTYAYKAGLRTGDKILTMYQVYDYLYDRNGKLISGTFEFPKAEDRKELTSYLNEDANTADEYSKDTIAYAIQDVIAHNADKTLTPIPGFDGLQVSRDSKRTIHFTYYSLKDDKVIEAKTDKMGTHMADDGRWTFDKFGISVMTENYRYNAGEAFVNAGKEFHYLFVNIFKALGGLFTPSGWKSMGGIVSVYRVSAEGVESQSVGYFLLLWGYISLNLGCFNLLPFPGLDGWQTLIALIETVSRRKMSTKFKGIANTIGLLVLMGLAVLLVIKDVFVR